MTGPRAAYLTGQVLAVAGGFTAAGLIAALDRRPGPLTETTPACTSPSCPATTSAPGSATPPGAWDLGGSLGTRAFADAVCARLRDQSQT